MRRFLQCALLLAAFSLSAPAADLAILENGFSIRHEQRVQVGAITRLYLNADGSNYTDIPTARIVRFEKDSSVPPPAPVSAAPARVELKDIVATSSQRHRIDPDLITSVILAESGFNRRAVSPKGAQGLMQLMPQTASALGVSNVFDPQANVDGGTKYLRELLERYNFDLVKALAAYNAGPRRVEQYGGVPPYRETRAYVARIVNDFNKKKIAERKAAAAKKPTKPATVKTASTAGPEQTR